MCTVGILLWTVWVQAQPLDEQEAQALREQVDQNEGLLVDLNTASSQELIQLPGIDTALANRIVARRRAHGPFTQANQLLDIEGISDENLEPITPYIWVSAERGAPVSLRHRWRATRGTGRASTLDDLRIAQRTTFVKGGLEATFLTERDPQEKALTDHRAASLVIRRERLVIALGSLRLGYGRGLLLSRRRASSLTVGDVRRVESARLTDHSTTESGRLTGVGAVSRYGPIGLMGALAQGAWDARLVEGALIPGGSGSHVSDDQIARRGRLRERFLAAGLTIGGQSTLSALYTSSAFSDPAVFGGQQLQQVKGLSLTANGERDGQRVFGEIARSIQNRQVGFAWLFGVDLTHDAFRLTAASRHYGPRYLTLRGTPLTAYTATTSDESGLFAAWQVRLSRRTRLEVAVDRHDRRNQTTPARGNRWLFKAATKRKRIDLQMTVSSRHEATSRDTVTGDRYRRQIRFTITRKASTRSRLWLEHIRADRIGDAQRGLGAGLEWGYASPSTSLSLWYQYHRVNGADARIYAYRPDVSAGLPVALNGVGSHTGAKVSRSFGPLLLAVRYTIRAIQTGIGTDWAAQVELHR